MTEEQRGILRELDFDLSSLLGRLEDFGKALDPDEAAHPIWEVWQPLSAAQARLEKYREEVL